MMTFTATREQRDNLEGLAYWVSDVICWAEDWRRAMQEDFRDAMRAKQITF